MGVTVGAVYKWENGLSMPEIRLLVELADFFEVSVGYAVQKSGADAAVERLDRLFKERKLIEGAREAEKVLQKYPNNFDVVFMSAQFYYLQCWQNEKAARRYRSAVFTWKRCVQCPVQSVCAEKWNWLLRCCRHRQVS